MRWTACVLLVLSLAAGAWAQDIDPYDQSGVPLEVDTEEAAKAKIVLVAGKASHAPGDHEYFAGMALLMKMLKQTPGVHPVMVRDGWPKNEKIFENARSIVFYSDGGRKHPLLVDGRMDAVARQVDKGAGFSCLHYGINFPREPGKRILKWLGGHILGGYSASLAKKWTAEFKDVPDHPIMRGVPAFTLRDEWYYNSLYVEGMKGVTPLLQAVPPDATRDSAEAKKYPGRKEIISWAFERADGGRGFGYTGGHFHVNWGDARIRRHVVNGILWSAKVEIPEAGAAVELAPADLKRNLDLKRPRKKRK